MKPGSNSPEALDDPDDDALAEPESVLSRREVRISLGIIGALLIVLGVLVARRWSASEDPVAESAKPDDKAVAATAEAAESDAAAPSEELPPLALRPVEGAEPPWDEPHAAPSPTSDPFARQESAFVTQDASREIGRAALAPFETATDEGFPDAADSGLDGIEPPLPAAEGDAIASHVAPPSAFGGPHDDETPPLPEEPDAEPPLGFAPATGAPRGEATAPNPLRAEQHFDDSGQGFDDLPVADPNAPLASEPAGFGLAPQEAPRALPPARNAREPDALGIEHHAVPTREEFAQPPFDEEDAGAGGVAEGASPRVAPAPLRQMPSTSTAEPYRTVSGDTFWSISKRAYGTGAYYQALAEFNRGVVPLGQSPAAGQNLLIPTAHELEQRYPQLCPTVAEIRPPGGAASVSRPAAEPPTAMPSSAPPAGAAPGPEPSARVLPRGQRSYRVRAGETLYDIAQQQLGSPLRWTDIYKLNRQALGDRPHDLRPDMELILPSPEDRSAANPRIRP